MNNADWEADAIYFLKMRGGYTDKELDTKKKYGMHMQSILDTMM